MTLRLPAAFQSIFDGTVYRHRSSTQGDRLARWFYEDLYLLNRSPLLKQRIDSGACCVNISNRITGVSGRRGDGTFGESLPSASPRREPGMSVGVGPTANVQIGVEVKILSTAMIKQIDRVTNDLRNQAVQFKSRSSAAITVALIGVNHAPRYTSYEGERAFTAQGGRAPAAEGPKAIARLRSEAQSAYDEFLVLPFQATNEPPFPFSWNNAAVVEAEYGAVLLRTLRLYETRFP